MYEGKEGNNLAHGLELYGADGLEVEIAKTSPPVSGVDIVVLFVQIESKIWIITTHLKFSGGFCEYGVSLDGHEAQYPWHATLEVHLEAPGWKYLGFGFSFGFGSGNPSSVYADHGGGTLRRSRNFLRQASLPRPPS
jgi:hypothetical protein